MSANMPASTHNSLLVGLCIDIPTPKPNSKQPETSPPPSSPSHLYRASATSLLPVSSKSKEQPVIARASNNPQSRPISESYISLRSTRGMQGLLLAETGGGLVELDPLGGGSGFKQGTAVMPGLVTPRGGASASAAYPPHVRLQGSCGRVRPEATGCQRLSRHATLLGQGVTPARNTAELKSLLGNSKAKISSGAVVLPPPHVPRHGTVPRADPVIVTLEQGKSRARVEMDILLDSDICVEGGYLTGRLQIKIRKRRAKEAPVLLAGGKFRVVGYEGIPDNNDRFIFSQYAAPLSTISTSSHVLYSSSPDEEGFSKVREGMHMVPFAMKLPTSSDVHVGAKGPFDNRSGVIVKYIAIASFKIKDATTSKHSIAHFYRSCELYPCLNPSVVFAPASLPLLSTAARSLFLGGTGKLKLTASLHRNIWIAGQKCRVGIAVHNESKKFVKGLTMSLIRTTTVFRPHPHLDVLSPSSADPDACQTTTTRKLVAETTLEAGQLGLRGHVTAKGWWTGVEPGMRSNFAHFILLPPDALSIVRSRLLEVQYTIRVSLVAGSLSSEVFVSLPVRIVNHFSIDPPPRYTPFDDPSNLAPVVTLPIPDSGPAMSVPLAVEHCASMRNMHLSGPVHGGRSASMFDKPHDLCSSTAGTISAGVFGGLSRMPMPRLTEENFEPDPRGHGAHDNPSDAPQEIRTPEADVEASQTDESGGLTTDDICDRALPHDLLGNLSITDSDEEVDFAVGSTRIEDDEQSNDARFANFDFRDERPFLQEHMQSTRSSQSSYLTTSTERHVSVESVSSGLRHHAPHGRLTPITQPGPRGRPKAPGCSLQAESFKQHLPGGLPPETALSPSNGTSFNSFPFLAQPLEESSKGPLYDRTPFSQRVDMLVGARRAAIKSPISRLTSEIETLGLPYGETGTQPKLSPFQTSATPTSSIGLGAEFACPESVILRRLAEPSSPYKVSTPTRPWISSSFSGSVRSRIAELEGRTAGTVS